MSVQPGRQEKEEGWWWEGQEGIGAWPVCPPVWVAERGEREIASTGQEYEGEVREGRHGMAWHGAKEHFVYHVLCALLQVRRATATHACIQASI